MKLAQGSNDKIYLTRIIGFTGSSPIANDKGLGFISELHQLVRMPTTTRSHT